ncbi:MAG: site-specific DNA-methyltransferase [Acidimicrobiales bacterium]|nr:site-specific DNA-methyltransferase [Acidimicrobiales bacterium]
MADASTPPPGRDPGRERGTSTSNFGVGRRESHDASGFYDRFVPPAISTDGEVAPPKARDEIWLGDSRDMDASGDIADGSVALVVTSPPYFAGKAYEEALGQGGIPADYLEYLDMLREVFAECARKLEPGGRMAINVANLGRKPYRSLSSDVITILEELGLLLRGEIIWRKGKGAGGSCAWGSFQRPGNPVLRDVTERIVVASKGRFDRAVDARTRASDGLPADGSMTVDDFLEATLDVWEFAPESATRVNHPAPFPVELPERLIHLYTYAGDLVLDPFMGVGSSAVAAVRTGRHYVGFDTDAGYIASAEQRIAAEREAQADHPLPVIVPPTAGDEPVSVGALVASGARTTTVATRLLLDAGFTDVDDKKTKVADRGVDVDLRATGPDGSSWVVLVAGGFTPKPTGLRRSDVLWRTVGHAAVLAGSEHRVLVLTTELPARNTTQAKALRAVLGDTIEAALELTDEATPDALRALHR